jgi:hypothetical protein
MKPEIEYSEMDEEQQKRARLLAEFIDSKPEEVTIETYGNTDEYHLDGSEYLVLDDDEADQAALDDVKDFLDDCGIGGFTDSFREYIMENCVNSEAFFRDIYDDEYNNILESLDSYRSFAEDDWLVSEAKSRFEDGQIPADAFPSMGDYEDPNEYFESSEAPDEIFDMMIELDFKEELADEITPKYFEQWDNAYEFLEEIYGSNDSSSIMKTLDSYMDEDAICKEAVDADGRGHFIAKYDGEEMYLGEDLYAYQVN